MRSSHWLRAVTRASALPQPPCPHPYLRRQHDRSTGPSLSPVLLSGESLVLRPAPTPSALPPTSAFTLYGGSLPQTRPGLRRAGGPPLLTRPASVRATTHTPGSALRAPSSHAALMASPNLPRLATPISLLSMRQSSLDAAARTVATSLRGMNMALRRRDLPRRRPFATGLLGHYPGGSFIRC